MEQLVFQTFEETLVKRLAWSRMSFSFEFQNHFLQLTTFLSTIFTQETFYKTLVLLL